MIKLAQPGSRDMLMKNTSKIIKIIQVIKKAFKRFCKRRFLLNIIYNPSSLLERSCGLTVDPRGAISGAQPSLQQLSSLSGARLPYPPSMSYHPSASCKTERKYEKHHIQ